MAPFTNESIIPADIIRIMTDAVLRIAFVIRSLSITSFYAVPEILTLIVGACHRKLLTSGYLLPTVQLCPAAVHNLLFGLQSVLQD